MSNRYLTTYNLILKNTTLSPKQTVPYIKGQGYAPFNLNAIKNIIQQYLDEHSLTSYVFLKNIFMDDIILMIYKIPNSSNYLWITYDMTLNNLNVDNLKVRNQWYDYESDSYQPIFFNCFKYKKQLWVIFDNKICFLNDFFKSNNFDIFITKKSVDNFPLNNIDSHNYIQLWIDNYIYWNSFSFESNWDILKDGYKAITSGIYTMYDVENDKFITRLMDIPIRLDNDEKALNIACYLQIDESNEDVGILYVKQLNGSKNWTYQRQYPGNLPYYFTKNIRQNFIEYDVRGLTTSQITLTFKKENKSSLLALGRLTNTMDPINSGVWKTDYIEDPYYILVKGLDNITEYLSYYRYEYRNDQKTFIGSKIIDVVDIGDYQLTFSQVSPNSYRQQYLSVDANKNFSIKEQSLSSDLFLMGVNNFRTNAFYFNNTSSLREEINPFFWMATNLNQITTYDTNIEGLMIANKLLIKRNAVIKVGDNNYSLFKIPIGVALNGNEGALTLNSNGDLLLDDFSFKTNINKSYYDTVDFYIASPIIKSNFGSYIGGQLNDVDIQSQIPTIQKAIPNNLFNGVKKALNNNVLNTYNNPFKKFRFKYSNNKFSRYLNIEDYTTTRFKMGILIANATLKSILEIYYYDENENFLASQKVNIPPFQIKILTFNDEFWF